MIIFPTLGSPKTLPSIASMFMTLARVLSVNNNTQKNAGREKVYVYQGQLAIFPLPVFLAKGIISRFLCSLVFLSLPGFSFLSLAVAPSLISMSFLCHMGTRNSGHFFRTSEAGETLVGNRGGPKGLGISGHDDDSEWTEKVFFFFCFSVSFRVENTQFLFPFSCVLVTLFHFLFPGGT